MQRSNAKVPEGEEEVEVKWCDHRSRPGRQDRASYQGVDRLDRRLEQSGELSAHGVAEEGNQACVLSVKVYVSLVHECELPHGEREGREASELSVHGNRALPP